MANDNYKMENIRAQGDRLNAVSILIFIVAAVLVAYLYLTYQALWIAVIGGILALLLAWSLKIARQDRKSVV